MSCTYLPARQIYHFMQNFGKFAPFVMATRQSPQALRYGFFARNADMNFRGPILLRRNWRMGCHRQRQRSSHPGKSGSFCMCLSSSPADDPLLKSTLALTGLLRYEGFPTKQQQLLHPRSDYLGDLDPIRRLGRAVGLALLDSGS